MTTLDRATVMTLARYRSWPAVSMYLTTRAPGMDAQKDRIAFKNMLRNAELDMMAAGARSSDAIESLSQARALLDDGMFWRQLSRGLAVFVAPGVFEAMRLDIEFPESVHVGDRFWIRPLLPALTIDDRFYLLTFSRGQARLYAGTQKGFEEVEIPGAPSSLADITKYDDYQRDLQFNSRTASTGADHGRRSAMFHGHGGLSDSEQGELRQYARKVSRGVEDVLNNQNAPLLVAGVEYMVALYREVDGYAHTVPQAVMGSPDELSIAEMHAEALRALKPYMDRTYASDLARYEELMGTDQASSDLRTIVAAAHEGRVGVLFVPDGETEWGSYDPGSGQVQTRDDPQPGDWDLAEVAAAETLLHGGQVYAIPAADAQPSAIFRY